MAPAFRRLRVDTRPFRHRDFRNLWLGRAVSTLGAEIGTVAIPYQVYTLTHSTALVGLLGLAALIPLLVVPLIGGAIADALDRRTVLLRTETGLTVVAAVSAVAGPAAGGLLIAAVGVPWSYGIDCATYAAARRDLGAAEATPLHRLHGDAATVGYLYAAPCAGAFVGSLVSGWTSHVRRMGLGVTIAACAWGAAIAASVSRRASGRHSCCSQSPAARTSSAPCCAARSSCARSRRRRGLLQRRAAQHDPPALDARPSARPPARDRVHAGRERAEPRRRVLCVVGCAVTALALPGFLRYDARPDSEPP